MEIEKKIRRKTISIEKKEQKEQKEREKKMFNTWFRSFKNKLITKDIIWKNVENRKIK